MSKLVEFVVRFKIIKQRGMAVSWPSCLGLGDKGEPVA